MLNRRSFVRGVVAGAAAAAVGAREAVAAQEPTMSLNVVYPNKEGARFDLDYYRTKHIPLVMKVMQARSVMLIEGVPNGTTAPPYRMIAHFQFASAEALQVGLANPGMAEVRADVARFTDLTSNVMLGRSV